MPHTSPHRKLIAPCGLDCSRCVGCSAGEIAVHARTISKLLGSNFQAYAQRLAGFNPAMNNYPAFREVLDALGTPSCDGCRSGNRACLPQCKVAECVEEKGIEFCFECPDFPACNKTGLPAPLLERWRKNNEIMKNSGVENFIKIQAQKPRYP